MLSILGMGYYHPATIIDNAFIEGLGVGATAEWIVDKIGINTRRSTLPLSYIAETRNETPRQAMAVASENATQMGVKAIEMALKKAGITAADVGMLVCNCCTPTHSLPVESTRLASVMGMKALAFDVFTACPAMALHADFVNHFKEEELPDYIVGVSTAALTQSVDYHEHSDGAIWGDGAAAWVMSPRKAGRLKVLETVYTADPTRCETVVVDTYGFFHQDGRLVRDFSVRQTVRLIKAVESKFEIDWSRDAFIGHQANATMLEQIVNNRGIPAANHWHNVSEMGNQAGAGAPAVLAMNWERLQPGQKVVVAVVGAGLSWGSVVLEAV